MAFNIFSILDNNALIIYIYIYIYKVVLLLGLYENQWQLINLEVVIMLQRKKKKKKLCTHKNLLGRDAYY